MSLDRLIDLARVTGDRLIVHNPLEKQDVVIMSVDQYENLLDKRRSVRGLSSSQLLDQINRDISIWRSERDEDEEWDRTYQLEDELSESETEGEIEDHWHRAGDIMDGRYGRVMDFEPEDDFDTEEKIDFEWKPPGFAVDAFDSTPNYSDQNEVLGENDFSFDDSIDNEIRVEDIPFEPAQDDVDWAEEPLPSDEPIFYEEPV